MHISRRTFLTGISAMLLARAGRSEASVYTKEIRIGLTPVILDDQSLFLEEWRVWLERYLNRPVNFIQRPRYRDITDLLLDGTLTAAWICGYPYIRNSRYLRILAQPQYKEKSTYQSLIIAGRSATDIGNIHQFKGHSFAFSDPDSNSGYLYPVYRFREQIKNNSSFFRRGFYSWGHKNTIDAVASGLADGGAVDSYVWDVLSEAHPEYTQHVRVVERSPEFGFPPLVTHKNISTDLYQELEETFLNMHLDKYGAEILKKLKLDRFTKKHPKGYQSIEKMMAEVRTLGLDRYL